MKTATLPTLTDVPPDCRSMGKGDGSGFFIFFDGKFCGWSTKLEDRQPGQVHTPWIPGCIATRADGTPGHWEAKGGTYYAGADRWEAVK